MEDEFNNKIDSNILIIADLRKEIDDQQSLLIDRNK